MEGIINEMNKNQYTDYKSLDRESWDELIDRLYNKYNIENYYFKHKKVKDIEDDE